MSQGELIHPKALPLIVGAQLIHADKLGEKAEDSTMPIRRAVNSTRETPPKSKRAEGEEEKPGKVKQPQFKKTKPLQFEVLHKSL